MKEPVLTAIQEMESPAEAREQVRSDVRQRASAQASQPQTGTADGATRAATALASADDINLEAFNAQPLTAAEVERLANVRAAEMVADIVTLAVRQDGRSLREIAAVCGVDAGHISRIANGQPCTLVTLMRIMIGLNVPFRMSIS